MPLLQGCCCGFDRLLRLLERINTRPSSEPLISEGGHWITAGTPGVDWHETLCGGHGDRHVSSISTSPGYAFGPTGPERFGDALALLTGDWKPYQMAEATVRDVNPFGCARGTDEDRGP